MFNTSLAKRSLTKPLRALLAAAISVLVCGAVAALTAPTALSPSGSLSTLTPTLNWTSGTGASYYQVNISKAPYGSANIIYTANTLSTSTTSLAVPASKLVANTLYRWDVSSCTGTCATTGTFATSNKLDFDTNAVAGASIIATLKSVGCTSVTLLGAQTLYLFNSSYSLLNSAASPATFGGLQIGATYNLEGWHNNSSLSPSQDELWGGGAVTLAATTTNANVCRTYPYSGTAGLSNATLGQSQSLGVTVTSGSNMSVVFPVTNARQNSLSVRIRYDFDKDGNAAGSGTTSPQTIAAGGSASFTIPVTASAASGSYYGVIRVETNTSGSSWNVTDSWARTNLFNVSQPALPDLVPQNVTFPSGNTLSPGQSFIANWTMANIGSGSAVSTSTGLRITTAPNSIGQQSETKGNVSTGQIAANSSTSQTSAGLSPGLVAPTTPGTYYLVVIADNSVTPISQTNSANDWISAPFTVQAAAPVTVTLNNIVGGTSPPGNAQFVANGVSYFGNGYTATIASLANGTYMVEGYSPPTSLGTPEYWGKNTNVVVPPTASYVIQRTTPYVDAKSVTPSSISAINSAFTFSFDLKKAGTGCELATVKVFVNTVAAAGTATWPDSSTPTIPAPATVNVCAGQVTTLTIPWYPSPSVHSSGTWLWTYQVETNVGNPSGLLAKTDSAPWSATRNFSIFWPTLPDLTVTSTLINAGQSKVPYETALANGNPASGQIQVQYSIQEKNGVSAGQTLTQVFISPNPNSTGAQLASSFIESSIPASGQLTQIRTVNLPFVAGGTYYVLVITNNTSVVSESNDQNNMGVSAATFAFAAPERLLTVCDDVVVDTSYRLKKCWPSGTTNASFTLSYGPTLGSPVRVPIINRVPNSYSGSSTASALLSATDEVNVLTGIQPVLFVHGYNLLGFLGGGLGTWNKFPEFVDFAPALNNGKSMKAFEFIWRTNADFVTVAEDLAKVIALLRSVSGQKVIVVAHSFGGVLARTALSTGSTRAAVNDNVERVISLGSPHSGLYGPLSSGNHFGQYFPNGIDGVVGSGIDLCAQLSCYDMGADVELFPLFALVSGLQGKGEHVANMQAATSSLKVPFDVGIGTFDNFDPGLLNPDGDRLISRFGQRFFPYSYDAPLKKCDADAPFVREVYLSGWNGFSWQDWSTRGSFTGKGIHSTLLGEPGTTYFESFVDSYSHPSWRLFKEVVLDQSSCTNGTPTTILISVPSNATYLSTAPTVSATSNSPATKVFSASGVCTVSSSGGTVSLTGAGTCTITVSQSASGNYLAGSASQQIQVAKAQASLSVGALSGLTVGQSQTVTVTVNPLAAGSSTISVSAGSASVCSISGATVTASASGTCTLNASVCSSGCANFLAASATAQFQVTAVVPTSYLLSVSRNNVAYGSVSGLSGAINCGATCSVTQQAGTSVTLTATAASSSYVFDSWSAPCASAGASCTFTMPTQPVSLVANFVLASTPTFNLIVTTSAGGITSPTGTSTRAQGSQVTILATPDPLFAFSTWSSNSLGCGTSPSCTFAMPSSAVTLSASFSACSYSFTPPTLSSIASTGVSNASFTVSPQPANCAIPAPVATSTGNWLSATISGNTVSYSATQNGSATDRIGTIAIGTQSISVTQLGTTAITYTLSVNAGAGGATAPSGTSQRTSGEAITATATPNSGFSFTNWTGYAGCGASATCTFAMPSSPVTLTANFTATPACTYNFNPTSVATLGPAAATGSFTVVTQSGCAIAAPVVSATGGWLTATLSGSTVNFTVTQNPTTPLRSGTITVAGQVMTINQNGVSATVPGAPTIGTATAGNAQATVSFAPPASDGGSAITSYTATCGSQSASGSASPLTVTALTNGVTVTCSVKATNVIGAGAASVASNSVTPLAPTASCAVTPIALNTTVNGTLTSDCASVHQPSSYAKYFTFTLPIATTVTISMSGGLDTYLFLLAGSGTSGGVLASDDDSLGDGVGGSKIVVNGLAAGTYTVEGTTYFGSTTGNFSLLVQTTAVVDTTPDPFSFAAQSPVALNAPITSNTITITGINSPSPISITGGTYSIGCTATFTDATATISNGQTVCVQHASAATNSTAVTTTLTVGGVLGTFTSTTVAASGCSYSISPATASYVAAGSGGLFSVVAPAGCPWTAVSSQPWLVITSVATGSGNGTVTFTVATNATAISRDATITVGGQVFAVKQDASAVGTGAGASDATFGIIGTNQGLPQCGPSINDSYYSHWVWDARPPGKVIARATDGKYVTIGYNNCTAQVAVFRYMPDGSQDPTFGSGGISVIGVNKPDQRDVAVQSSGRVLVILDGDLDATTNGMFVVALTPSGAIDTGFGIGGKLALPFDFLSARLNVDVTDKIHLVGRATNGDGLTYMRFNANGTADTSLAGVGASLGAHALRLPSSGLTWVSTAKFASSALFGEGILFAYADDNGCPVGSATSSLGPRPMFLKIAATGATTIAPAGAATVGGNWWCGFSQPQSGTNLSPTVLDTGADGKIYLQMSPDASFDSRAAATTYIYRFNADLNIDTTWGDSGRLALPAFSGTLTGAELRFATAGVGLKVYPNGRVVSVLREDLFYASDVRLSRTSIQGLMPSGATDTSFGTAGSTYVNAFAMGTDFAPDGKLVVASSRYLWRFLGLPNFNPSGLLFNSVPLNTTATKTFGLSNPSLPQMAISSVTATAPFSIAFSTCPTPLTADASCTITVQFTPTTSGVFNSSVVVVASGQTYTLPVRGTTPITCSLDVVGSGTPLAVPDGLLLLRYMLGFKGIGLTQGLSISGPRNAVADIEAFLSASDYSATGMADKPATIDGLIFLRLLQGVPDSALLSGINVPVGAAFRDAAAIRANVNARCGTVF